MRFFRIHSFQEEDMTIRINVNNKLDALAEYLLLRHFRKQFDDDLNQMKCSSFASTNPTFGWIETAATLICSFYSSYLQERFPLS